MDLRGRAVRDIVSVCAAFAFRAEANKPEARDMTPQKSYDVRRNPLLAERIARSGRKHRKLASKIGISPTTLSRILCGHSKPRPLTAKAIAAELGCTVADIGLDPEGGES